MVLNLFNGDLLNLEKKHLLGASDPQKRFFLSEHFLPPAGLNILAMTVTVTRRFCLLHCPHQHTDSNELSSLVSFEIYLLAVWPNTLHFPKIKQIFLSSKEFFQVIVNCVPQKDWKILFCFFFFCNVCFPSLERQSRLISQMSAVASARLGWSQKTRTLSESPMWVSGQDLRAEAIICCLQSKLAGRWIESRAARACSGTLISSAGFPVA